MESEILRLVDSLRREKEIDAEIVFQGIEAALLSAARKHLGSDDSITIRIDRTTGKVIARDGDREITPAELGRIAAQTAKQVMIQKIREAERDAIAREYSERLLTIVTGSVQRFEGPNIIVNLGRTEGFLPKSEQIANEVYHIGERIRAIVLEVKPIGSRVRVVLSRTHPEFVIRLFELEVPEVADGVIEIKGIAREPGHRTKIAVTSHDPRVDCVGACVGVQGTRIRSIVDELNGEKIDIVRWNASTEVLITNTLKPAEISSIRLDAERRTALVIVPDDQLSLAIGKRGQNVRLASKLTGWDIDIKTQAELEGMEKRKSTAQQGGGAKDAANVTHPETKEELPAEASSIGPTNLPGDASPSERGGEPATSPDGQTPTEAGPSATSESAQNPVIKGSALQTPSPDETKEV